MTTKFENFSDLSQLEDLDVDSLSETELDKVFNTLNDKMNIIYKLALGYNDYINNVHNYNSDINLTMLEIHTLTDICDCPNSTVTSLANAWGRSLSATSQTVRRLMNKGLVTRENAPDNGKVFYLSPTETGRRISVQHKRYDVETTIKTMRQFIKKMPVDEIETMFHGLSVFAEILSADVKETKQNIPDN